MSILLGGTHRESCGPQGVVPSVFLHYASYLAVAIILTCALASAQSMQAQSGVGSAAIDNTSPSSLNGDADSDKHRRELTDVFTYHNDSQRTGWNPNEVVLTPARVSASTFGLLKTVQLDDQVDAQPLLVAHQRIEGQGTHSVLYVATENNTIYAIDALSGTVLKKRTLGPKFVGTSVCSRGTYTHSVGVNSTPTIDRSLDTLFVMSGTVSSSGVPEYHLHALDLETLADRARSPVIVKATQTLEDGTQYVFNAAYQRQRPALLESEGHIYAGFGSFGDCDGHKSRGWVLGWDKFSLQPMSSNESVLPNRKPDAGISRLFLSSIWMSGFGLAADDHGDVYFTTGNTEPGTYDEVFNISESAVRFSNNLSRMMGIFTPADVADLDTEDKDYSSGGLMVLPDQDGRFRHIAVGAGKDGRLFVLDRDNMGGHHTTDLPNNVMIGGCFCGPSYFEARHGTRVVTSGGTSLMEWSITTDGGLPSLSLVASSDSAVETSRHGPGFFTSISSDGSKPGTAIIWAVGHGSVSDNSVTLHAFDATPTDGSFRVLWSGVAGSWGSFNPNIVPTVANGHVYVASDKELRIFGLLPPAVPPLSGPPIGKLASPLPYEDKALSITASTR